MKKMDGLLDEIMREFREKQRRSIFHRCSYWGTWNRTIVSQRLGINTHVGSQYYAVELDLTPVNPNQEGVWEPLRNLLFRSHGTAPDRADEDVEVLPPHVVEQMIRWYGEELTQFMLTGDFLPLLDLEKLERSPSGGTPFHLIRKVEGTCGEPGLSRVTVDDTGYCRTCRDVWGDWTQADVEDQVTAEGYMMRAGLDPDKIREEYEKGRKRD